MPATIQQGSHLESESTRASHLDRSIADIEFITGLPARRLREWDDRGDTHGESLLSPGQRVSRQRTSEVHSGGSSRGVGFQVRARTATVESIIDSAISQKASDIHIEPHEKEIAVRFRIDGQLNPAAALSPAQGPPLVGRLKVMARLDITEKRRPQDGRIRYSSKSGDVDLRISVLPTLHGEKIAIRILPRTSDFTRIASLGMSDAQQRQLRTALTRGSGMVIVTGPTGSGKTTTMYAALRECMTGSNNICTLEDPIEYCLEGANQSQIREEIGYTFASSLRSLLRQDPDIVLVGEMRDTETARIAIRAALTGHLVLSTLHTNNAASTITRLRDMGIEPYLIASALKLAIAQRLVRKLCDACGGDDQLIDECHICSGTGYRGRTAIFETLVVDRHIRDRITSGDLTNLIHDNNSSEADSLQSSAQKLIEAGVTSQEEAGWIGT